MQIHSRSGAVADLGTGLAQKIRHGLYTLLHRHIDRGSVCGFQHGHFEFFPVFLHRLFQLHAPAARVHLVATGHDAQSDFQITRAARQRAGYRNIVGRQKRGQRMAFDRAQTVSGFVAVNTAVM